ncbi:hypothetical protein RISK_006286 [Rhodopirellula islandica]|uniref:Uncharacterized protein n=1 Tax=Rhodopirellula islandica TaxID=595434 RepID=A0A0J1B4Y1_RHOIS|nr:hypothetical protein RISK_006286 [Rhodopirellula islandica]
MWFEPFQDLVRRTGQRLGVISSGWSDLLWPKTIESTESRFGHISVP